MHVVNVVGGSGEESMAAAEMKADAICRNGELWVVAITCFFWRLGGFFPSLPFTPPPPRDLRDKGVPCMCFRLTIGNNPIWK
jgi:hypothetical protein